MKNNFLLKKKVLILLIVVSVFALLVVGISIFPYVNKTLVENKKEAISSSSLEQMHSSAMVFKNNELFVHMLSTRTRVREYLLDRSKVREAELTGIFEEYSNKEKKYLAIYLLDKNGIGLVSTDPRFVGQDYSFRDYFKNSIKGDSFIDVAIGKTSNQFGYYFSEPVLNINGDVLGVMVVKVDDSEISSGIIASEVAKDNTIMLVDKFGIVLAANEKDRKIKSLGTLSPQDKKEIEGSDKFLGKEIIKLQYDVVQQGLVNYKAPVIFSLNDKEDGDQEIVSLIKIEDLPFFLVVEVRLNVLNSQVVNIVTTIVLIVLLILLVLSFIIYYFLSLFIRPLDKFKLFFENISKGDFSKEIDIDTKDEFGNMALSVNKMSKDLKDLYKNLDEKVKEQTININNKIQESENQNRAILNILEDVDKEKSNVEQLANDLEKFKLAVENASDQIIITDSEGLVIYGNKAVLKITGYTAEEAIGKKSGALWKLPMPTEYYKNLWDTIKKEKKTFIGEIQNKRKNGEVYTAVISISIVFNDDGDIVYFVAIERDITKEKEIDRAKTEFVSLASHQLRTPLSAINWYTEMLLAGDAGAINEEQKKYLEEVATGNKRMVDLVDDLLNVSRLDMGTFTIDSKSIDILELVKSALFENKSDILNKKLIVEESYGEGISQFIADEKLIRMIFQNLLSNAVKYTSPYGKVKLELIKVNNGDVFGEKVINGESLAFSVTDSGMGIPERQQDKIFSKLFRADNAKESETEGTGLGLYVIKSIVDQSGGQVWFKSEENKGTTFYVVFPITGMKMKNKELA